MRKVVDMPTPRLRSVTEERLIDRPLSIRRSTLRGPWRKKPGLKMWLVALAVVVAMFGLS